VKYLESLTSVEATANIHFAANSMCISSVEFFWLAPENDFFPQECVLTVQGHPRSLILVLMKSAYATS